MSSPAQKLRPNPAFERASSSLLSLTRKLCVWWSVWYSSSNESHCLRLHSDGTSRRLPPFPKDLLGDGLHRFRASLVRARPGPKGSELASKPADIVAFREVNFFTERPRLGGSGGLGQSRAADPGLPAAPEPSSAPSSMFSCRYSGTFTAVGPWGGDGGATAGPAGSGSGLPFGLGGLSALDVPLALEGDRLYSMAEVAASLAPQFEDVCAAQAPGGQDEPGGGAHGQHGSAGEPDDPGGGWARAWRVNECTADLTRQVPPPQLVA